MDKKKILEEIHINLSEMKTEMIQLGKDISVISECITKEKFFPQEITKQVISCLSNIEKQNLACKNLYQLLTDETFKFEQISKFETVLSEQKKEIERESKIELVERFYSLHSEDEDLEKELLEQKDKLRELLKQVKHEEQEFSKIKPYMDLLEALKIIGTDQSGLLVEYITSLSGFFGIKLIGKILIENKINLVDKESPCEEQIIKSESLTHEVESQQDNVLEEETVDVVSACEVEQNLVSKDNLAQEEEIHSKMEDISASSEEYDCVMLSQDLSYGELQIESSYRETKKFGVSDFINDLKRGSSLGIQKKILEVLDKYSVINEGYFHTMRSIREKRLEENVDVCFTYLLTKGYIRKYVVGNYGHFYCLTAKCEKAFYKKEACSFLGVKMHENLNERESIPDSVTSALTRIACAKMLEIQNLNRYFCLSSSGTVLYTEAFLFKTASVIDYNKFDIFVGCFWSNANECQEFCDAVEKTAKKEAMIVRIFFVGVNKTHARKIAKFFTERYGETLPDIKFIYSLCDDEFYEAEGKEILTPEQLFKETEIDSEQNEEQAEKKVEERIQEQTEESDNVSAQNENVEPEKPITNTPVKESKKEKKPLEETSIQEIKKEACKMIISGKVYCAVAFLHAYSQEYAQITPLYNKLAYAVNDPMKKCSYSTDLIFDNFLDESGAYHDYLMVATVLRTFFYNHVQYDYSMKTFYEGNVKSLSMVSGDSNLSNLIYMLMNYKDVHHKGIDVWADYHMKDKVQLEAELNRTKKDAREFYDALIIGHTSEIKSNTRFIKTKKLIFSRKSDIAQYITIVMDNQTDMLELMEEFLTENFMKENSCIDAVNVDSHKIDEYLDEFWNRAGEDMRTIKKTSDLMGSLRQNLVTAIYKAVTIMCKWASFTKCMKNETTDLSIEEYKKIKGKLLHDICTVSDEYQKKKKIESNLEERAGMYIFLDALNELKARIEGTYKEESHEYFYVDFLKQDQVLLDHEYLPVMDKGFRDIKELTLVERIRNHCQGESLSFNERLEVIFKEHGDDYGSAELILKYLDQTNAENREEHYNLSESITFAKRDASNKKNDFIENLELMQSYGQIDNSKENKKEKILQIINSAFEFACESNNYGFFLKVLLAYENQIREDAKVRENSLVDELEAYRLEIKGLSDEEDKADKLKKVEAMLKVQNYTVAEDLLTRIKNDELDMCNELFEEDYLKQMLEHYDYYYEKVKDSSYSFSYLVKTRIRNKDDKGARRLAENWMINGQKLNQQKLSTLLMTLGFAVGNVKEQKKIGKYDNYIVKLAKPVDGRKVNYKHPIAAFGSQATEEGFRIVFLYGKYDTERIIAAIKEIGNAKNTIILLDYALALPERRRLARKIKEEAFSKIFGIIDRVLFMYLISNYNEERVNQMLMSVMMPFCYYQPYVWDSANVMPPEIFMGRNEELEKIESPKGVNIVYGGRQLGKSALLKMAKNDIDKNENHDRAVLVDIKGLDYKRAAIKIGRALYDEGVLNSEITTDDWDTLARAIKLRLTQEKEKIPYLLLLLDEADVFIESCGEVNYQPFDALKDVQSVGVDRFKFVIAGLRNIVRFKRNHALGNNSVITHLESMTVKPFKEAEARELLEIPLYYLGLRFPKDKEALITLIFASANYFPGLIQLYCAKLIEAMRKGDYAGYDECDTPIYEVKESHIKKVLSEEGFMQQIREKFEITLKLDEDNYYYLIALLMALLYHEKGYKNGFLPEEVYDEGCGYGIAKISNLKIDKLVAFMEELEELNVLRKTSEKAYLFNRYSFFQMMGSRTEVEDKLEEYMED